MKDSWALFHHSEELSFFQENVALTFGDCSKLEGQRSFPDPLIPFAELGFAKVAVSQVHRERYSERWNSIFKCSKRINGNRYVSCRFLGAGGV